MLMAYADTGQLVNMRRLWALMGFHGMSIGQNAAIATFDAFVNAQHVLGVRDIVSVFKDQALHLDLERIERAIRLFADNGDLDRAESLVQEVDQTNSDLSEESLIKLMTAYGERGDMKKMREYCFRMMALSPLPNADTYAAVIRSYAMYGDVLSATQAYEDFRAAHMPPHVDVYNGLLRCFCRARLDSFFLVTLKDMVSVSIAPNHETFQLMMFMAAHLKRASAVREIWVTLCSSFTPTIEDYNFFIYALSQCKLFLETMDIVYMMEEHGLRAHRSTAGALLSAISVDKRFRPHRATVLKLQEDIGAMYRFTTTELIPVVTDDAPLNDRQLEDLKELLETVVEHASVNVRQMAEQTKIEAEKQAQLAESAMPRLG
jgi:hypothetical protein